MLKDARLVVEKASVAARWGRSLFGLLHGAVFYQCVLGFSRSLQDSRYRAGVASSRRDLKNILV